MQVTTGPYLLHPPLPSQHPPPDPSTAQAKQPFHCPSHPTILSWTSCQSASMLPKRWPHQACKRLFREPPCWTTSASASPWCLALCAKSRLLLTRCALAQQAFNNTHADIQHRSKNSSHSTERLCVMLGVAGLGP